MTARPAGFALLDVLIALAILGGALVTIQLAMTGALVHQTVRQQEAIALGLSQETVERVLPTPPAPMPVDEAEAPFPEPFERFTGEVLVADWEGKPDLKEVTVIIRWKGVRGDESYRLHTLAASY
ncbi:MAG: hypothetical protein Q8R92_06590 [Deltaproteobacteria bacterium]|nr:hypothetical protein [Deltaproteobacteria bacterium]